MTSAITYQLVFTIIYVLLILQDRKKILTTSIRYKKNCPTAHAISLTTWSQIVESKYKLNSVK